MTKENPTPSRKEAEAARKKALKPPMTRKEQIQRDREARRTIRQRQQEALRTGDDKFLPLRDRGPIKRFARDYVDRRRLVAEYLLPILLFTFILTMFPQFATVGMLALDDRDRSSRSSRRSSSSAASRRSWPGASPASPPRASRSTRSCGRPSCAASGSPTRRSSASRSSPSATEVLPAQRHRAVDLFDAVEQPDLGDVFVEQIAEHLTDPRLGVAAAVERLGLTDRLAAPRSRTSRTRTFTPPWWTARRTAA